MWRRSFVATTVALGGTVDDALGAIGGPAAPSPPLTDLVTRLQAPHRATRAAAIGGAVYEIVKAIDEVTLR